MTIQPIVAKVISIKLFVYKFDLGSITGPAQKIPVSVMPLVPQISLNNDRPQQHKKPLIRLEGTSTTNIQPSSRLFTIPTTTQAPLSPILMQTLQPLTIKVGFLKILN